MKVTSLCIHGNHWYVGKISSGTGYTHSGSAKIVKIKKLFMRNVWRIFFDDNTCDEICPGKWDVHKALR